MASLDLFSVPTDFLEPKGLYALEAMAAGLPIIQPDHGSFPELISASEGGVLFEAGNQAGFVERMAELIQDGRRCREISARGRQFVMENRNMESMSSSTGNLLKKFLEPR